MLYGLPVPVDKGPIVFKTREGAIHTLSQMVARGLIPSATPYTAEVEAKLYSPSLYKIAPNFEPKFLVKMPGLPLDVPIGVMTCYPSD